MAEGVTYQGPEVEVGIGKPARRIDGWAKVTGQARYAADVDLRRPVFAVLKTSSIARGRITDIDETAARRIPGILDILTYRNMADSVQRKPVFELGRTVTTSILPLGSDRIQHRGQIVAVVLGETLEAASEAAYALRIRYDEETPSATLGSPGAVEEAAASAYKQHQDDAVGDAASAFAAGPIKIDATYSTATQHHNPMELFSTVCEWQGDKLTVHEPSQSVGGNRAGLAAQLGVPLDDIRWLAPYTGGAFGSRGVITQTTALIAVAAARLRRPVKLVATRAQGFTTIPYRAETRHHMKLAATPDGKLVSLMHEGWELTSRPDGYMVAGTHVTTRLYACPNVASKVTMVHADRNTPGYMRAPAEMPYLFALECAMDELAYALGMDPVALRLRNDTRVEPIRGLPFTSRHLAECFHAGAKAFGWKDRDPTPGAMRDGDWLVGWGTAAAMYPANMGAASARVTLTPRGRAKVQMAGPEIGTGAYTVVAIVAADRLGLPLDHITVELGDTDLPASPVAGGSAWTASACTVVDKACVEILGRLARAAVETEGPLKGADPASLKLVDGALRGPGGQSITLAQAIERASGGAIEVYAENIPHGAPPDAMRRLFGGRSILVGGASIKDRMQFSFGAQFVEVRVHSRTGEIRVPRMTGAFAAGRVINPTAAESQLKGGMIWGMASALFEATEIDARNAAYINDNFADYLVPVNADVGAIEVIFVPELEGQMNPLGIKGLGEIGVTGANAAVANAVFHATGKRVRDLPIRIGDMLST